ncbi:MAG: NADAR family protein [Polyangiales bacterium]
MLPTDLPTLLAALAEGRSFEYRFFWGHRESKDGRLSDSVFSQWWKSAFEVDGHSYSSAEQWMMAGKARLFGDDETLARILATDDPSACKALGRKVRGFDEERWRSARFDLVTRGNVAKFTPHAMRRYLLSTDDQILVEASPTDCIWGIGLSRTAPDVRNPRAWRGENLLGFALVRARELLRA